MPRQATLPETINHAPRPILTCEENLLGRHVIGRERGASYLPNAMQLACCVRPQCIVEAAELRSAVIIGMMREDEFRVVQTADGDNLCAIYWGRYQVFRGPDGAIEWGPWSEPLLLRI